MSRRYTAVLLVLTLLPVRAARPQNPSTPATHELGAWLDAFNRGDRAAYLRFLEQHDPADVGMADRGLMLRRQTGGFDMRRIDTATDTHVVALLQEHLSDQFVRVTLDVRSDPPVEIQRMALQPIPRPDGFPLPHLTEGQLTSALRETLQRDADAGRFAGAVLVAAHGKTVFSHAYGFADREQRVPNTLDTRFRIGSMNKMFTATAILQLVQAGKVNLDDPLGKYLADYPNKDVANKVTIAQLLTHTGGTGDIFGPDFAAHRLDLRTLQDYVTLYGNRPLRFEPGSQWEYSNYGFILLGRVIERVSGESYYDYVREHIFGPAGMTSTGSEPEDQPPAHLSTGYTMMGEDTVHHPNTETLPYRGTSAGGGYSTVGDLVRFADALQDGKLLDAHDVELLTTGKVDTPVGRYAYGFEDLMVNGIRCFGHNGGAPGMNGDLAICPSDGYVVAVLANLDPPAATDISQFITNRLPL